MVPIRFVLSTLGLPLLALACSPVTRDFPTGSGGATSSAADSSSASAGGAGGSGGSGGSTPTGSCDKVGTPFDILGSSELGSGTLDTTLLVVPDQESLAMVHVVLSDNGQSRTLVRTVLDDVQPLGNFAQFGNAAGGPQFKPIAAWGGGGHLHIEGFANNSIEELNYDVSPTKGVGVDGKLDLYTTPIECLQGGSLGEVVFAQDGEKARYLAVCNSSTAGANSLLFSGGWTGKTVQIASDIEAAAVMHPILYSFVGGEHLVFSSTHNGSFSFSHGATVEELATLQPISFSASAGESQAVLTMTPRTADDGVTIIGAHFNLNAGMGEYWAGSTRTKDYATLAQVPPPGYAAALPINSLGEAVTPSPPGLGAQGMFSAGSTPDDKAVRLFWLTREGTPLVFGQEIYKSVDTTVRAAAAAPWGDSSTLVVWIERTGASSPYQYLVRGQRMACKLD